MLTSAKEDLEHVTKFIVDKKDKFLTKFIDVDLNPEFLKKERLTIDYPEDIQRARERVRRRDRCACMSASTQLAVRVGPDARSQRARGGWQEGR